MILYSRKPETNLLAIPSRLVGMLFLLASAALCIALALPHSLPIPQEPAPLHILLQAGSGDSGRFHYIDAGGLMALHIRDAQDDYALRVNGGTVADALRMAQVTLSEFDLINCDPDTPVYAGLDIVVTRVTVESYAQEEAIPFNSLREVSADKLESQTAVLRAGVEGRQRSTYDIIYHNGQEVERVLTQREVLREPVDELLEVGGYALPTADAQAGTLTFDDGRVLKFKKQISVVATAYSCENSSSNITKTGTVARVGAIAVDPKVIPLGSKLFVQAADGSWYYGECTAEDTGGFIKGKRVDLYYDTIAECNEFGRRRALVYVLADD